MKEVIKMKKEKSPSEKNESKSVDELYGLEPKMSLQSVNFAPSENTLLNDHFEGEDKQCD
ncbi:hypothetical protein J7E63_18975 [Bacillus sp. ISL-75]|uniref:hypothetical protein n=1 Tax=Bacillus sp. ISL-75 TaxID=2819137 RepID=UPI001BE68D88|nr:hypothetical protein [Bacillus sp. ISL-75]MBT2728982.1 hypothetical protein [Bacillus sp. ISL-75]